MAVSIHPQAIVDPSATLGENVSIGAFAMVEANVVVGDDCQLHSHSLVRAGTTLGKRNLVHPFAVLGGPPQDRRYKGEPTTLVIGDDNTFREHTTAHRGTTQGGGITRIGSGCLFMAGAHIAHDVIVGNHVTLANNTLLGGHVEVFDYVVTGGHVAAAPFVRIGNRAFLAGGAMVERDIPPFVIAAGDRATVRALNRVGLERSQVPAASRDCLKQAFRLLFVSKTPRKEAMEMLLSSGDPFVQELLRFLKLPPKRQQMP